MKKTIIAAAIATVVAAPAMADVTVSGQLETLYNTKTDEMAWDNAVKISASEDLGNGMTISGHTYVAGKMKGDRNETVAKLATNAGTFTFVNASDGVYEGTADAATSISPNMSNYRPGTAQDVIVYTTPSINGAKVSLFNATSDAKFDIDIYKVSYTNGPLTFAYVDKPNVESSRLMAATYTMGDLKLGVHDMEDAETAYAATYKMGNNTVAISDSNVDGDDVIIALSHNMSKKTKVYVETESGRGANVGIEMKF